MTKNLLTTIQAAEFLCVSKQFLEQDRFRGAKIPYVQVGDRAIRYRLNDLEEHLEKNLKGVAIGE